ncbi:MAG: PDDEXK nuclease domain-containing protein [Verrucomicrobia bacterium]|jgi:predicted nuclease of restriction endonuclease-like (RecB) superfamily|nr:PDDEXK nuclease domain-containing protein [Verrucomicrobiota bacterium]
MKKKPATPAASPLPTGYGLFLRAVKERIRLAQVRATLSANAELIYLYWDVGRTIAQRQLREGWGAAVIPRLARDIANALPEVKGFSERNIKRMLAFAREYPSLGSIVPQAAALLPEATTAAKLPKGEIVPQPVAQWSVSNDIRMVKQLVSQLPWGHNVMLWEQVKDLPTRLWYMRQTIEHGWSRNILALQIKSQAHARAGKAVHNFHATLPPAQSDLAEQVLKDPYIFDFLTLAEPFRERELELGLLRHLEKFLLELGQGFAFVGRQYHFDVGEDDFYLDLLFYHLRLRCFVVVDLKRGPFKAEYAGKMNFYCNVVDDRLRHCADQSTIGLILCQDKNKIIAEYALKNMRKAIGVSEYELTRALPADLKSSLPAIAEVEAELERSLAPAAGRKPNTRAPRRAKRKAGGKK